ncbi:MAG: Gldg family protein, partial [Thermoflexales bacterium]|nr:Gldg family protein [Thermoflexales bacterium]
PLLAPLAPRVRDLLREYQIAGRGKVTAQVVDPATDPEVEAEASRVYGIQPTPLQVAGRYEASIINTYFDILVRYGDQNTTLSFRDLIEIEQRRDGTIDVRLRNLEYDLTRAIKRVTSGFRTVEAVFASLQSPARLDIIVTRKTLPEALKDVPDTIEKVAKELQQKSSGKFEYRVIDPDQPNAPLTRKTLVEQFGLRPILADPFGTQSFYLNMLLQVNDKTQAVYPEGDFTESSVRTAIEAALKRNVGGFLNVIGLWTPAPEMDMFSNRPINNWNVLREQLGREYTVRSVDLSSGQVPPDVSTLLLINPSNFDDKARYAVDQFLMRGGSVIIAGGNYAVQFGFGGMNLTPLSNGIGDLLAHYGITIEQKLVMDPRNTLFPVEVSRNVGGAVIRDFLLISYPFFVNVLPDSMDRQSPIVAQLPEAIMSFASPVTVDAQKNANRKVSVLLRSSPEAWLTTNTNTQPNFNQYPELGFPVEGERASYPLAVAVQGVFESFYKGKPSPFDQPAPTPTPSPEATPQPTPTPQIRTAATLEQSPDTARLIVIGSADFLNDALLNILAGFVGERYLSNLQFIQN